MVEYSRPTMIYLDEDSTKIAERFRPCFCPSRELPHAHNLHPGHLANMFIGDKLERPERHPASNLTSHHQNMIFNGKNLSHSSSSSSKEREFDKLSPFNLPSTTPDLYKLTHRDKESVRVETSRKRYLCDICRKTFQQVCQLKQHRRIHTGEKPYKCGECGKAFTQASQLNQHVRLHTGEKPYSCEICNKRFTQLSQLKSHRRTHQTKMIRHGFHDNGLRHSFHDDAPKAEKRGRPKGAVYSHKRYTSEKVKMSHTQSYSDSRLCGDPRGTFETTPTAHLEYLAHINALPRM